MEFGCQTKVRIDSTELSIVDVRTKEKSSARKLQWMLFVNLSFEWELGEKRQMVTWSLDYTRTTSDDSLRNAYTK